jgi:hypothetical protein
MGSRASVIACIVIPCILGAACDSADALPLGGPFGGTATALDAAGDVSFLPGGSEGGITSGAGSGAGTAIDAGHPTWTYLYDTYLSASGPTPTPGNCDSSCHNHNECGSAKACFSWIGTGAQGQLVGGGDNPLFIWDADGYMPLTLQAPVSGAQADADFAAWIAEGSPDD